MDKIETLRRERELLLARLKEIENVISDYEALEHRVAAVLGHAPADQTPRKASIEGEAVPPAAPVYEAKKPTPMRAFIMEVYQSLGDAEHPMDRTEMLNVLADRGVVVGGADPRNTLSARLSRLGNIINLKGFGYWLANRPYEPAEYEPRVADEDHNNLDVL